MDDDTQRSADKRRLLEALVETSYRAAARKLVYDDIGDPPRIILVAAEVCKRTGIQPSEFIALSRVDQFTLINSLNGDGPRKPGSAVTAASTGDTPAPSTASVNARMIDLMGRDSTATSWSSRRWARHLKCSEAAVRKTAAWTAIMQNRESSQKRRKSKSAKRFDM